MGRARLLNQRRPSAMSGTGSNDSRASRHSSVIRTIVAPNSRTNATAVRMVPWVMNCSSAFTSLLTRDISSPVDVRSKKDKDNRWRWS